MSYESLVTASLEESIRVKQSVLTQVGLIEESGRLLIQTLAKGGRIYFAGNGGSAADSQHLAAELVGRFEEDNCLPALALTTDTSILSAVGNDFGWTQVFERQVRALGRSGDLLVAISTSGNSENILLAARAARAQGMTVVGLAGGSGGKLQELCDRCLVVPCPRTCRVQEVHITVGHIWCEMIEAARHRGELGASG